MYLDYNFEAAQRLVDGLEAGLKGPLLQRCVNKAARPLVKAAKAQARQVSKTYAKYVDVRRRKAKGARAKGGAWVGIGVRATDVQESMPTMWGGGKVRRPRPYSPHKLTHLLEHGFQQSPIVKNAKGGVVAGFGHRVAPRPLFKSVARQDVSRLRKDLYNAVYDEVQRINKRAQAKAAAR